MNKTIFGDCRATMRELIAQGVKVQMCVTSPPYFGLRDYGHEGQLGLESTPYEFVANMVEVFRLVRDLLADDGVLWLNLGDSYAANRGYQVPDQKVGDVGNSKGSKVPDGLKVKDLIGIPWRVAFALQADGWYLRQDIIWHKPNPMPESVTDRCTKSHEYLFLLSKNDKYYFNGEAIAEPLTDSSIERLSQPTLDKQQGYSRVPFKTNGNMKAVGGAQGKRNRRSVWTIPTSSYSGAHFATFPSALIEPCILAGSRIGDLVLDPFMGSGTTGQVSQDLGRRWIGCELNTEYLELQHHRTAQQAMAL
jgi:DNA modification methylase